MAKRDVILKGGKMCDFSKFNPGELYFDVDHWFNIGADVCYLLLSRDKEKDGEFWWRAAKFLWISYEQGFCGACVSKLKDYEIEKLQFIGNIKNIFENKK